MRIEALWQELEVEAHAGNPGAWLTRFALPQPAQPLLVALETASSRRALLLPLPKAAVPARREWPDCRGLEVFSAVLSGQAHLGVRLRDPVCADVFAALAVFVDGCFWHACPLHATKPRNNAAFWRKKLAVNQARDRLVNRFLRQAGWRVLRIWEHELAQKREARLVARLRRFLA